MIEPRCLIDEEGRAPLFQGSFVGHGKWFRPPRSRMQANAGASGRGEVRGRRDLELWQGDRRIARFGARQKDE